MTDTITIDADYLAQCSRSVPAWYGPAPTVLLMHRHTGTITRHALMADHRTISAIGEVLDLPRYDAGFGRWPYQESLIRL